LIIENTAFSSVVISCGALKPPNFVLKNRVHAIRQKSNVCPGKEHFCDRMPQDAKIGEDGPNTYVACARNPNRGLNMKKLHRLISMAIAAATLTQSTHVVRAESAADRVIAIDVLLLPDATMVEHAKEANALLRTNYSKGYTLGGDQTAHITLVHRYVQEKDLPKIEAAVAKVSAEASPLDWELTASGYRYGIWSKLAITNISIDRTPNLDRYQEAIAEAVEPFAVKKGSAEAFSTSKELPKIEHEIIDYVENFVPKSTGENYSPHVTIGVAHEDFVLAEKEKEYDSFRFKVAGVAIYQLGNFGTAQKKLWQWEVKPEEK
jgi:hypothetical protein